MNVPEPQLTYEDLRRKLTESEQLVRALMRGEIDTLVQDSTHVLLRVAQEQLRSSERRYRRIVDNTSEGVWMYDAAGNTTFVNPRMAAMLGCKPEEAVGSPVAAFMDLASGQASQSTGGLAQPGTSNRGQFRLLRGDGSELWVSLHAAPLFDSAGELEGSLALVTDVTEQRKAEETRYHLAAIVECSDDAIISMTLEGILQSWNRGAEALFGYSSAEAVNQKIFTLIPEGGVDEERDVLNRLARGESIRHYETVRKRKDGSLIHVSLSLSPVRNAAGEVVGVSKIARDITERRRADETRNRLASIVESSHDAIISRGVDGIIHTWNRGAEVLTQWSAAEAVGQPISLLFETESHPDGTAEGHGIDGVPLLQQVPMVVRRKDGSRVSASVTSSELTNDDGKILGASIILRDLSSQERYAAALRRSEEQLRQAQKMEAVGSLAGGVAHDFNNLLSVVLSYTSLIIDDLKPSDPLRADLEQVHKAGLRATGLTRQLLAFSRQQVLQPVVLDMNQVVIDLEKMLARLLREDIRLSLLPSPIMGKVHADPGQIEQVIMNLVVNARDAMPNGGNITIETANVVVDEEYAADHGVISPGAYVMLAVTDTGTGMDAATRQRIFEPFFTTKDKSKGTGLGLSTVYGIIQQSGGHIQVYSEPNVGTVFKVFLPQTDRVPQPQASAIGDSSTMRGNETILLVEDEEQVRIIMRSILRKHGYNVIEAQNGGEAFLLCEQYGGKIHLMVTDVVMPRMSGRQLAERLGQARPDMRVLYVSGYTDDTIVHHGVLDAGIEFLQKPILPGPLLRKIRHVLDSDLRPSVTSSPEPGTPEQAANAAPDSPAP